MFDKNNLPLERPFIRYPNQSRSHRILSNIIPFLRIAFAVPDDVIKRAALPNRDSAARDGGSYNAFQSSHPDSQIKIESAAGKQVNVVGHDHVAPHRESSFSTHLAVFDQSRMNFLRGQQFSPVLCAERNEIERRIVFLKNSLQSGRLGQSHNQNSIRFCRQRRRQLQRLCCIIIDSPPGK